MENLDPVQSENLDPITTPEAPAAPTVASWKDSLPDGYKEMPCYEKFNSQEDCLKAYGDVQKIIGKKGIIKPGEGADAEEINQYHAELGRPETSEGYGIPEVDIDPVIKDQLGDFKEYKDAAHKLGLTPKQFEGLVGLYMEDANAQYAQQKEAAEQRRNEAETNLRRELGATYDETIGRTSRMLQSFLGEDGMSSIASTGIGNDPSFIKGMSKLATQLGEAGITGSGGNINLTPEQAKAEVREMLLDKTHAVNDKWHPEHKLAVKRYADLQKMAHSV